MSLVKKQVKKKSGLTSRQKAIIEILTKFTATNPVTIAEISGKLKLSARTVLREMPSIEKWISDNEFKLIKKPGVGIVLDESLENQKLILELLEIENIEKEFSKEERRKLILGELLYAKEPLKSFYFTSKFKISEGTLSNDLDFIEEWLRNYEINIVRKPGMGVYIQGSEDGFRQAIANAVYEFMNEEEILGLLVKDTYSFEENPKIEVTAQNRLLNFIDNETIKIVEETLIRVEKKLHIKYTDSGYMALIVHISLAVKRIQNHEKIVMEPERLSKLSMLPEFSVAEEIGKYLEKALEIEIPKEEIGFITMHLMSANIWMKEKKNRLDGEMFNIRQLVLSIIMIVEKELGLSFRDNEMLVEDLCNHMEPVLSRLSMGIRIKNSQMQVIQENYSDIYCATEKACEILKEAAEVALIPETEIAFITMHFCAAVEKMKALENKVSVVVVCPTGIGTSRMLVVSLTKEFSNIEIKDMVSAIKIDTDWLFANGVDFIISTVKLDVPYPYICVNPILSEEDKHLLRQKIKSIDVYHKPKADVSSKKAILQEEIRYISDLGHEILQLLSEVTVFKIPSIKSREELILHAGALFATDEKSKVIITKDLQDRDTLSDTYISEFQMLLLHCKTDGVSQCRFGYIRIQNPFSSNDNDSVIGAIVMLIPKNSNKVYTDIMSEVSGALIENEVLFQAVQHKEALDIAKELEKSLGKFYKKMILKRLEC